SAEGLARPRASRRVDPPGHRLPDPPHAVVMTARPYHVYVIQARGERDFSDCQAALAHVPARMSALPFLGDADELMARTRDADALVVAFSPVTRAVTRALGGLTTVVRTGRGHGFLDVPAATELGGI